MKLERKYNIFSALIGFWMIAVILISSLSLIYVEEKTDGLRDITLELDILTKLNLSLQKVANSFDMFMEMPDAGHAGRIAQYSEDLNIMLLRTPVIRMESENQEMFVFLREHLADFLSKISRTAGSTSPLSPETRVLYEQLKKDFLIALEQINTQKGRDIDKISRSDQRADQAISTVTILFFFIGLISIAVITAGREVFFRQFIKPLVSLNAMSRGMADGKLDQQIEITAGDEIEELANNFNIMASALRDKIGSLTRSIEHEQSVVRELQMLNELMGHISSEMRYESLVEHFIGKTKDLMKADAAAIFIYEGTGGLLRLFLSTEQWLDERLCGEFMGVDPKLAADMQTIIKNDARTATGGSEKAVHNFIAIPLDSDKNQSALLIIINKQDGFSRKDEDVLLNFTFQAFLTIALHSEIADLATTDGLTGLHNHRTFQEKLSEELKRAERYGRSLSVLMIDIDHFKAVNDIYGHQTGDSVLRTTARIIKDSLRSVDFTARYGGEEFVAILPETECVGAFTVAERIRTHVSEYLFIHDDKRLHITVSLGFSCYPNDAKTQQQLIGKADEFLYFAKENGRNMTHNPGIAACIKNEH
jgi:diguanylate cyclase (GGDEF)-like protein